MEVVFALLLGFCLILTIITMSGVFQTALVQQDGGGGGPIISGSAELTGVASCVVLPKLVALQSPFLPSVGQEICPRRTHGTSGSVDCMASMLRAAPPSWDPKDKGWGRTLIFPGICFQWGHHKKLERHINPSNTSPLVGWVIPALLWRQEVGLEKKESDLWKFTQWASSRLIFKLTSSCILHSGTEDKKTGQCDLKAT